MLSISLALTNGRSATGTDLLRYEDFQSALYDILTQAETPLTVAVFGPWGSGKTSLRQMLPQQLEGEGCLPAHWLVHRLEI